MGILMERSNAKVKYKAAFLQVFGENIFILCIVL